MAETNGSTTRRIWRQSAIALVLIGGGFALGAASVATAHGDMEGGWRGGWHHHHHGPRVGMIQRMVHGALDNVGATTAQEDKVHDIIAKASTDLDQKDGRSADEHGAMKKQVLELMKAPTLDRAAFDKLRADKVAAMDAKSKVIENALFDAAGQLTPEQRAKLVSNIEDRMEHHGWGGWRHHDEMDGHDGDHGGMDHHGPHDGGGEPDHG